MAAARTPAQWLALVYGAIYLLVGIVGFFVTGFDGFLAESYDEKLLIFSLNPMHNIVHILLGAVWLGAAGSHTAAKTVNALFGVVLLLVGVLGLFGALKFLAIENAGAADNYLHLVTGAVSLYFGTAGAREGTTAAA